MTKEPTTVEKPVRSKERYNEPLLIKHEPLRNVTGVKYGEKVGAEKKDVEA